MVHDWSAHVQISKEGSWALPLSSGGETELRWTTWKQGHLTLAFLGEVGDDVVDELTPLGRAAARHQHCRCPSAAAVGSAAGVVDGRARRSPVGLWRDRAVRGDVVIFAVYTAAANH